MRYTLIILALAGIAYGESQLFVTFGSNSTVMQYDSEGKLNQTPVGLKSIGATFKFTLVSTPIPSSPKVFAGVDGAYTVYDSIYSAGLYINPFVEVKIPFITLSGGFNIDFSSREGLITDGANALMLKANLGIPFFHGELGYAYTFESDSLNPPDVFTFKTGPAFKIGLGNFTYVKGGLDVIYRKGIGGDTEAYNLSILPYAGIKISSLEIDALIGLKDEYGLYGVSISGKNTLAPGVGIILQFRLY